MRLRLTSKLILAIVLIEVVMLSILVWNSVRLISSSHSTLLEESVQKETLLIANILAPGLLASDYALINDSLALLEKHKTLTHLDVLGSDGVIIASLQNNKQTGLAKTQNINEFKNDKSYEDAKKDGIFDVVRKIDIYGQHLGSLHAGYSIASVIQLTNKTRLQNTTIAIIEIILSIIVTTLLALFLTKGLRKLEDSAKIFGEGNLNHRVEISGNDEMSDVAQSFNKMAMRLQNGQTQLEQKNIALIKKEKQISLLMDSTAEGIYGVDINGTCTFVNQSCLRMLGYTSEDELIGASIHEVIHHTKADGSPYPKKECAVKIATKNNKPGHSDKEVHWKKDGSSFPVEWWSHPIIEEDNITGTVVTFIDISERKSQEAQLRQSQKLEALGKLTGGIAHDYNNMLGVILGYAELLELLTAGQDKVTDYINEIKQAGDRGANLTKKLLTISRQQSSDNTVVNINTVLKDSQLMLEKTLTARINIIFNLHEDVWNIYTDKNDLLDSILNISINAMHAIETNGTLTFQTSNELISEVEAKQLQVEPGEYIALSITDNGCGMDEETKSKVFDPFFSTKGDKGTGLGLSQVYSLLQRSEGSITLYSEVDIGSRFVLYFPRYTGNIPDEKTIEHHSEISTGGNETILIVDDEPALISLASQILEVQGYRILTANNGAEALAVLEKEPIELLLSDVIMPEMDGYQLASMVKEKFPQTKIQLVSGFSDNRNRVMTDKFLHENLLHKPYTSKKLLQAIRKLLDS